MTLKENITDWCLIITSFKVLREKVLFQVRNCKFTDT